MKPPKELPGIDDCDQLYSLSSRSGDSSVYLAITEVGGKHWCQMSVDSNEGGEGNYYEDLGDITGPYETPQKALIENVEFARQWFRDRRLQFVYCNDSRPVIARVRPA